MFPVNNPPIHWLLFLSHFQVLLSLIVGVRSFTIPDTPEALSGVHTHSLCVSCLGLGALDFPLSSSTDIPCNLQVTTYLPTCLGCVKFQGLRFLTAEDEGTHLLHPIEHFSLSLLGTVSQVLAVSRFYQLQVNVQLQPMFR